MRISLIKYLFLFCFLFTSKNTLFAQEQLVEKQNASTELSLDDNEAPSKEKKKKKDKDKDKADKEDEVTIDAVFGIHLLANILTVIFIIGFIYHRNYHRTELLFTFFAFNFIIFLLTYVMNHVKISMGAAFGLFAVFSMLRYRTEGISPKDMTYLFIVIAVGLICAIRIDTMSLAIICGIVIVVTWLLDGNVIFKRQFSKLVRYDKIELITPDRNLELIDDLRQRTGLNVFKVSIDRINFLSDEVLIEVFYHD